MKASKPAAGPEAADHRTARPLGNSKICFYCARRRLAGQSAEACADCVLLNIDRWAELRARAAKAAPNFAWAVWEATSTATMPARAAHRGVRP